MNFCVWSGIMEDQRQNIIIVSDSCVCLCTNAYTFHEEKIL